MVKIWVLGTSGFSCSIGSPLAAERAEAKTWQANGRSWRASDDPTWQADQASMACFFLFFLFLPAQSLEREVPALTHPPSPSPPPPPSPSPFQAQHPHRHRHRLSQPHEARPFSFILPERLAPERRADCCYWFPAHGMHRAANSGLRASLRDDGWPGQAPIARLARSFGARRGLLIVRKEERGGIERGRTMPIIDGVGDELLYTALVVVAPVVFLCRSSLGQPLSFLKQGVHIVRLWIGNLWTGSVATREQDSRELAPPLEPTTSSSSFVAHMDAPPDNDCCSVCHDSFTLPCQANCAHWFCGECILRVWQHSSVLQPCKCPICRRAITLLIPTEVFEDQQNDPEVERIMRDLAKYNRIFGGGPVSFMQRVRDMPLLLRRMVGELMDPQRAIPLVHRTRILFFLVLLAVYVFSPLDVIPEGVLGLVGLLDDLLVIIMVLFYLAMLYRSTLILHHGGQPQ